MHDVKKNKYILCRPKGGFNDMLTQIEKCWKYAEIFNRKLIIDSLDSGFHDHFDHYFISKKNQSVLPIYDIPNDINCNASVFPNELTNTIQTYNSFYDIQYHNFFDKDSGVQLTFDFSINYEQNILIHEQCGRNNDSINALNRIRLTQEISKKIQEKMKFLGNYISIHIRNTDYKTNYKKFFNEIKNENSPIKKYVLCTDDYLCQQYAKDFFENKILFTHKVPNTQGAPLHYNDNLNRLETNINTIMDLLILAMGQEIKFTKTENNIYSGFSLLAKNLNHNKKIVYSLLDVEQI